MFLSSSNVWCHILTPKVLEHFVQAWSWAALHWVIFVQPLDIREYSMHLVAKVVFLVVAGCSLWGCC